MGYLEIFKAFFSKQYTTERIPYHKTRYLEQHFFFYLGSINVPEYSSSIPTTARQA